MGEPASTSVPSLDADEIACLATIARHFIPADDTHGLPAADDAAIIADIVTSLHRDRDELRRVLSVARSAFESAGGKLTFEQEAEELTRLRSAEPAGFAVFEAVVARAYYRDDRVLTAIGMEPRAPFPRGFDVEPGDWSLLDAVRERGPIYRRVDTD